MMKRGPSRYQQQQKKGNWSSSGQGSLLNSSGRRQTEARRRSQQEDDIIDSKYGFERFREGPPRLGWLLNMLPMTLEDSDGREVSAIELFFLEQSGDTFKAAVAYAPYFYVQVPEQFAKDAATLFLRRFITSVASVTVCLKEDLDMSNHLSGKKGVFLKFSFWTVADLMEVRSAIFPSVKKNRERLAANEAYHGVTTTELPDDILDLIQDIREYDVPYYVRVSIDLDIRVGAWYEVTAVAGKVKVERQVDMVEKAEPRVLAWDIECTKAPLKFPDASVDQIFMISYMCDGQGYLIINREIVSEDIEDFEYTPKPDYPGPFTIFNEADEYHLLRRFYEHILEIKPHIFVTYNGDYFDWPFVETRSKVHGINMQKELGVRAETSNGSVEYRGRSCVHLDCFYWVKRDSYLPQGSQGLKAVTKYKLGYDPVEVDPEDMVKLAVENPTHMASYSVSDAVATYYLYEKYVHLFVFSLCTIIPMGSEDVLRKGSGTLCEALLMVEAFKGNIICPNKKQSEQVKFHDGHLLDSETYIGGHVECLETGVYRSDLPEKFKLVPAAFDQLIRNIDGDLSFAIEVEAGIDRSTITNYDEVRAQIIEKLELLRDTPNREEHPVIYHLDVGAMYPNIILTNRLQPCSIVNETICASCDHNKPDNRCQRQMEWVWRGDFAPATFAEYKSVRAQLEGESIDGVPFLQLPSADQAKEVKKRLKTYCTKVYKKVKVTEEKKRVDTICMRENPFYVNTVRAFRDRRYDYKILTKKWAKQKAAAEKAGDPLSVVDARDKMLVYDSLQLAHKCILNSFYGYVMRKGARWHSMEMAGIVTNTGAELIMGARQLVEQIGRPLELDTDGIWCILPASFPENFSFTTLDGSKVNISYPCVMLNAAVHENYSNHQYQDLVDGTYKTRSECSIFFEVDGPYRCMVLPASTEEGRLLKKRYAVFNFDGSLAELKGFELKRRGELQLIKIFQSHVFEQFLKGDTLQACYAAVAQSANHWLDILETKGKDLSDEELLDLISENRTMTRSLDDYGDQKSTSIKTAKRLAEFLGDDMVKDKGLNCKLVIANRPAGAPVTERAIPTAIFAAEVSVRKHYLRKWLNDPGMSDFDIRAILDWEYYRNRLNSCIQKIITIPAALQMVDNPVPRVQHPDWLARTVKAKSSSFKQKTMHQMFAPMTADERQKTLNGIADMEDFGTSHVGRKKVPTVHRQRFIVSGKENDTGAANLEKEMQQNGDGTQELAERLQSTFIGPRREEDYTKWLQVRKQQWKEQRNRRKRRRQEPLNPDNTGHDAVQSPSKDMMGFLQNASRSLVQRYWQVLEIQPLDNPGTFQLWVLTEPGKLQSVTVTVQRTFYVNSITSQDSSFGKPLRKLLPRGRLPMHLYEISMSETAFQKNKKYLSDIVADPEIEGVYELQTPLHFRAVENIGCVAAVNAARRSRPITSKDPLRITELEYLTADEGQYQYLSQNSASMRQIFLYFASTDDRAVFGLFLLEKTNGEIEELWKEGVSENGLVPVEATAHVWFADPYRAVDQIPNLNRLFEKTEKPAKSACTFKTTSVPGIMEGFNAVSTALAEYLSQKHGPTMVQCFSPMTNKNLRRLIPALTGFPVATLYWANEDNQFPPLQWQTFAAQRMIERFLQSAEWWMNLLHCARYSNIPVGNIGQDMAISMADVFLARFLHKNNHILWASPSTKPDLGGHEGDDNDAFVEDHENVRVCEPGNYMSYCVELSIESLAVNTLMNSSFIHEIEGAEDFAELEVDNIQDWEMDREATGSAILSKLSSQADDSSCSRTFRLLKKLVEQWFRDVTGAQNHIADHLLQNFYRWLYSSTSLLHEPVLHRLVHRLMKKVFMQLLSEFRRLGALIVQGSFSRIILCTQKTSATAAADYISFICNTITSRPLFSCLKLTPNVMWENLLLLDEENFGGVPVSISPSLEEASKTPGQPVEIVSHWNVAEYLPEAVREYFRTTVAQFIRGNVEYRRRLVATEDSAKQRSEFLSEKQAEHMRKRIENFFTDKLLDLIPELAIIKLDEDHAPAVGKKQSSNCGLELTKYLCRVFRLEPAIEFQVLKLKKTLLRQLNVKEFSEESKWHNPAQSFILSDVICTYCNHCRDIDLCRDPELMEAAPETDGPLTFWKCSECQSAYDKEAMEFRLVEMLERRTVKFQLQDLVCKKCGLPQADTMTEYCQCAGRFDAMMQPDLMYKALDTLKGIAQYHDFRLLLETVEWFGAAESSV